MDDYCHHYFLPYSRIHDYLHNHRFLLYSKIQDLGFGSQFYNFTSFTQLEFDTRPYYRKSVRGQKLGSIWHDWDCLLLQHVSTWSCQFFVCGYLMAKNHHFCFKGRPQWTKWISTVYDHGENQWARNREKPFWVLSSQLCLEIISGDLGRNPAFGQNWAKHGASGLRWVTTLAHGVAQHQRVFTWQILKGAAQSFGWTNL